MRSINQIFSQMQFLKSKESLTFEQLSNVSPKELELKQQEPYSGAYSPPSNHIILKYYARFIEVSKVSCFGLLIQIILSIFYYEFDYQGNSRLAKTALRVLIINALFSAIMNILVTFCYNDWRTAEGKSSKTRGLQYMVFSTAAILVQPYQFLEGIYLQNWNYMSRTYLPFEVNYLLTIFSLFKLGIIIYSLIYYFKFKNSRSSILWRKYGPFNPYLFVIKCLFKQHAISLVSSLFVFNLLFFSFAYRVSERNQHIVPNIFQYYENCLWMVFVTMTTVGYGDCSPVNLIGRSFGFCCTFYGVIVVSITVLVVINTFQMDSVEAETLRIIKNLKKKRQIKQLAGQYIRLALWRVWLNKRLRKNNLAKLMIKETRQEKVKKMTLKQLINISKLKHPNDKNLGGQMSRQFQQISAYTQNLNYNFDSIMNFLSSQKVLNILK